MTSQGTKPPTLRDLAATLDQVTDTPTIMGVIVSHLTLIPQEEPEAIKPGSEPLAWPSVARYIVDRYGMEHLSTYMFAEEEALATLDIARHRNDLHQKLKSCAQMAHEARVVLSKLVDDLYDTEFAEGACGDDLVELLLETSRSMRLAMAVFDSATRQ